MPSSTDNVKLGVCTILFDGQDLGLTKGGVEVEVSTATHEVKVDQYGETVVGEIIVGRNVTVKVPLAEVTLENLVAIMPGAQLSSNGIKATGTITLSTAVPVAGDKVTVNGQAFTFKAAPVGAYEVAIGATFAICAASLSAAIDAAGLVQASVAAGVITLTANDDGVDGNLITLTKTFATAANCTLSGATLTGGTDPTLKKVTVNTGVNANLLSLAKSLVLRPLGTNGADDFTIFKAATPGALKFAYQIDQERIYEANFKAYPNAAGNLFAIGDVNAP